MNELDLMRHIYSFGTKTVKPNKDKTSYVGHWTNPHPDVYMKEELYKQGFIRDTCYLDMTHCMILDIDAHNGEQDEAYKAYTDACGMLNDNGVHYCSGISSESYDLDMNLFPRGYHIYVVFDDVQSKRDLEDICRAIKSSLGYENIDLYPCHKAIRLWWIPKPNGVIGRTLHWDDQLNNDQDLQNLLSLYLVLSCSDTADTNIYSKYQIIEDSGNWEEEDSIINRTTLFSWVPWVEELPSGMPMGDLFDAVKQKAIKLGYRFHPFSYRMIQAYYGIRKEKTAKMKLYRWCHKNKVVADRPSTNSSQCHLYATGIESTCSVSTGDSQATVVAPKELTKGMRNDQLLALIQSSYGSRSESQIIDESMRLFRETYRGLTSEEEHHRHTLLALENYRSKLNV